MTSKQRAYLKSLAMTMDPIFQFGKNSLTPENTKAIAEALEARELIKINVLHNCADDPKEIAQIVAERTHSQVVQVDRTIPIHKDTTLLISKAFSRNYTALNIRQCLVYTVHSSDILHILRRAVSIDRLPRL